MSTERVNPHSVITLVVTRLEHLRIHLGIIRIREGWCSTDSNLIKTWAHFLSWLVLHEYCHCYSHECISEPVKEDCDTAVNITVGPKPLNFCETYWLGFWKKENNFIRLMMGLMIMHAQFSAESQVCYKYKIIGTIIAFLKAWYNYQPF